jgi:hypothetical protein
LKRSTTPFTPRTRAVALLILLVAVLIAGIYSSTRARPLGVAPARGEDDVSLHAAIVQRLTAGQSYYEATGDELRQRGYPTRSIFNWRTPLLFSAVAAAPGVARVVLIALGLLLLVATVTELASESLVVVLGGAVAQAGAIPITLVPGAVVLHEAWTGALVALSVCLYLRRRWIPAAVVGVLALFVRELAAPYCVVAGLLAIRARRWREVGVWGVAAVSYAAYFAVHAHQVQVHGRPGDLAHVESWIQWGGLPFILSTVRWNGWLTVAPAWAAAVALVVLLAGVFDRALSPHLRLSVAVYFALFAVAGHDFNNYWGAIPLLTYPLLFGYGLRSLHGLVQAAAGRAPEGGASVGSATL